MSKRLRIKKDENKGGIKRKLKRKKIEKRKERNI